MLCCTAEELIVGNVGDPKVISQALRAQTPTTECCISQQRSLFRNQSHIHLTIIAATHRVFDFPGALPPRGSQDCRVFIVRCCYRSSDVPLREGDTIEPASPYGASKFMSEQILRDASAAYGLKHLILRYFNVAGADQKGTYRSKHTFADASNKSS